MVLGSSATVREASGWVAAEVDWLRDVPLPVLGICFGAQLLSAAFGGSVERAPGYEVGWVRAEPVYGDGDGTPSLKIRPGPWFQLHGDRCVLPETARLLARNEVGVQAFSVGEHLGVQFHPEVDAAQLRRWLGNGGRTTVARAGKDSDALVEETAREEPRAGPRRGARGRLPGARLVFP